MRHGLYNDRYYAKLNRGGVESAEAMLAHLFSYYRPQTVIDVGCGAGAWLGACIGLGVEEVVGVDGPWNTGKTLSHERIRYFQADLTRPFRLHRSFDLVISLEVAEHLPPASALDFVESLTALSEVILFSAAIPGQGGKGHLHERWQSYWAERFQVRGFLPYDLFRSTFWGTKRVQAWYRQNTFLYVKPSSPIHADLQRRGIRPIANVDFMNCVHPAIFTNALDARTGLRFHMTDLVPSLVRAIARRMPAAPKVAPDQTRATVADDTPSHLWRDDGRAPK